MTTHYMAGRVSFSCDSCPETHETDLRKWREAWDDAKEAGWRAAKIGGEWEHSCPACQEDENEQ